MSSSKVSDDGHKRIRLIDLNELIRAFEQQSKMLEAINTKQTEVLKSIDSRLGSLDERQAAADTSTKPIPQSGATSSSAWMALWQSFKENVSPSVQRLGSGLDALLIFIGLFSAVVSAFLVDSTRNLDPDDTARTNELLVNLTEIVLAISGTQFANLSLPYETSFEPNPEDVRSSVFWSMSLVLSLLIAALSVVCRSFLGAIFDPRTPKTKSPSRALTEVRLRWIKAERLLKPVVELLPQLMAIPVIMFLMGLLENLFDKSQQTDYSFGMITAFSLSSLLVVATIMALLYFMVDALRFPATSPFQSTFSKLFFNSKENLQKAAEDIDESRSYNNRSSEISTKDSITYYKTLRMTRDDSALEQSSAILEQMMKQHFIGENEAPSDTVTGLRILLYLLSPEASLRSNLTASAFVSKNIMTIMGTSLIDINGHLKPNSDVDADCLLQSIIDLARRTRSTRGARTLMESNIFEAIIAIMQPVRFVRRIKMPNIFCFLFWDIASIPVMVNDNVCDQLIELSTSIFEESSEVDFATAWPQCSSDPDNSIGEDMPVIVDRLLRIYRYSVQTLEWEMRRNLSLLKQICQRIMNSVSISESLKFIVCLSRIGTMIDFQEFFLEILLGETLLGGDRGTESQGLPILGLLEAVTLIARQIPLYGPEGQPSPIHRLSWSEWMYYPIEKFYRSRIKTLQILMNIVEHLLVHASSSSRPDQGQYEDLANNSQLEGVVIQFLNVAGRLAQTSSPHDLFEDKTTHHLGTLIHRCLCLWPETAIPPKALEDIFVLRYYPLTEGWERKIFAEEAKVVYHNNITGESTEVMPDSIVAAKPRAITPADVVLPPDNVARIWKEPNYETETIGRNDMCSISQFFPSGHPEPAEGEKIFETTAQLPSSTARASQLFCGLLPSGEQHKRVVEEGSV